MIIRAIANVSVGEGTVVEGVEVAAGAGVAAGAQALKHIASSGMNIIALIASLLFEE